MSVRIGEVMIQRGLLTAEQVSRILEEQANRHRPFGELAERMFGVDPADVEQAWVEQYASITRKVNVLREATDERAMRLVDRRQAWQFRVLPLRFDGPELMVATTAENLTRALRFVSRCLTVPCYLVLTEGAWLGEALSKHFPMGGLNASNLDGNLAATLGLVGES